LCVVRLNARVWKQFANRKYYVHIMTNSCGLVAIWCGVGVTFTVGLPRGLLLLDSMTRQRLTEYYTQTEYMEQLIVACSVLRVFR
jgi:hypothetical protein